MPGSLIVLGGPTYVSLMQNIVPNLLAYYRQKLPNGRQILTEGIHYVTGTKDLPKHFAEPLFPIIEPKHTISTVWGTTFRLVSADRPESAAGISAAATVGSAAYTANRASKAGKQAAGAEADSLAFAMEKYDDWQEVFGPIQQNLANYYSNLDADFIATQGLESYEVEKTRALQQVRGNLAERGISGGGVAAAVETDIALQSASERARIRAEAPMKVAQMQTNFLQVGLGQNPDTSLQTVLEGNAARANQRSVAASKAAGDAVASGVESLVDYYAFTQAEK
jgi:hypothetical protein